MPRWTPESRLKQAALIQTQSPWTKSTGPRTEHGKARSSRNAWKGGIRAVVAHGSAILRGMAATAKVLFSSFRPKRVSRPPRRTFPTKPPSPAKPPSLATVLRDLEAELGPEPDIDSLSKAEVAAIMEGLMRGEGLPAGWC